jgi:hypothetical protein
VGTFSPTLLVEEDAHKLKYSFIFYKNLRADVMIIYVEAYVPKSRKSMSDRHGVLFSSSVLTYLGIDPFKPLIISNKSQKPMYGKRKWEPLVPLC